MSAERQTEQKETLLRYLKQNAGKHLSIQEIHDSVKNEIGLTTVYRIVNSLIEKGIVTKIPLENKQGFCYRYDNKSQACENHYHLICEKCNNLVHFESDEIKKLQNEIKQTKDFEIDEKRIVFFGLCNQCKYGDSKSQDNLGVNQ